MHSKDQPVYPMRVARDLTGLTERQIRYYDSSDLVCPYRTEGGHRLYSQRDIERLTMVARLLSRGVRVNEIRERLQNLDEQPGRGVDLGDAHIRTMRPQVNGSVHPSYPMRSGLDELQQLYRQSKGEWKK